MHGFRYTVIAAALVAASPLWAAEWTVAPMLQFQTGHDNNLRLSPELEDAVLETSATASVTAKRRTETSDVSLTGGYSYINYQNADDRIRDLDQQFLQAVARKRWDRWAMGATGGLRRDDLLRTIRETLDNGDELGIGADSETLPDDPPNDELGVDNEGSSEFEVAEQVRRTFWRSSVYSQYELTERSRMRLGYGFAKRDYDSGDLENGIADTERHTVDLQFSRDLSERSVITTSISAAKLNSDVTNFTAGGQAVKTRTDAEFYQGLASWRARFSETTRIEAGAGLSHLDSDIESNTGFLLRLRGSTTFANGKLLGEVRRALAPNIFGNVAETDFLRLRYSRALNQFIGLDLNIKGQRRRTDRNLRDQLLTSVTANWAVSREFSLGATYGFAWLDRDSDGETDPNNPNDEFTNDGTAKGHRIALTLTYQPQTIRIGQ